MEEPVFDVLRTREQLGYNVYATLRNTFGVLGFSITVDFQADKFRYVYVICVRKRSIYGSINSKELVGLGATRYGEGWNQSKGTDSRTWPPNRLYPRGCCTMEVTSGLFQG